jgi:hypothetical protein
MNTQNPQNIQQYFENLDESEVRGLNRRSKQLRLVEPLLEFLNWPLRNPTKDIEINLDQTFGNRDIDYLLMRNNNPLVALEILEDKDDFNLYNDIPESCIGYIVTDGIWFEFNLITKGGIQKVDESNISNLNLKDATFDTFCLEGILSNLIDDVISNYNQLESDREVIKEDQNDIKADISRLIQNEISSLSQDTINKGSNRLMDFLGREINSKKFTDIVIESKNNDSLEKQNSETIDDEDIILIVKQSIEEIKKRKNNKSNESSSEARIVTYTDLKPDYIVFYIEENNAIEYISTVESYSLIETKDSDSAANMVYSMESSPIRDIKNKIKGRDDMLDMIEYCYGSDINNADNISDIETVR